MQQIEAIKRRSPPHILAVLHVAPQHSQRQMQYITKQSNVDPAPHRHVLALPHVAPQHIAHAVQAQVQAVHEHWVGDAPAGRAGRWSTK